MNYIKSYEEKIDYTRKKYVNRCLPDTPENLAKEVNNVVVILSASRSGSSLFKDTLTQSDDILFTDGEETPYLIMTKNEFPFVSSDLLDVINNKNELLYYIFSDLGKRGNDDIDNIYYTFINRVIGQLPFECGNIDEMTYEFELAKNESSNYKEFPYNFLKRIFTSNVLSFYDNFPKNKNHHYTREFDTFPKIEDPPFVIPECKKQFTMEDLRTKPLVFKTPENAYKIGMFEKLFPNATIKYIYLTRGFAQTVNGLMDGWEYQYGFFSKNLDLIDIPLNIRNYSEKYVYGNWWNFDFPPNWIQYIECELKDICVNQWASIHEHVLDKLSSLNYIQIKFEDFIKNPQDIMNQIYSFINIKSKEINTLKNVMITENPSPYRWKKRKEIIYELAKNPRVKDLMNYLNYSMKEETWI